MDLRKELLDNALMRMHEAGIGDLDVIKTILVRTIGDYEITERCTEITVIDDNNSQIIKYFLASKKIEGGSEKTAETRFYVLKKFDGFICKPLTNVNTFDILRWLAEIQKTVSLSTAESYRTIIASLYSWMHEKKIISENPANTIKPIKHPDPIKKSFTPVEIDAMKTACKTKLDRSMIELLLSSGMRCEELCNLKWSDIDFVTKDVTIIEGKGGKNRVTMMDDVTRKYLLDYRNGLKYKSEYVFAVNYRSEVKARTTDSVWRKIKDIAKKAGVEQANPHKFRRTFATNMHKRGLDVRKIQMLLGHANINTTMIYIDGDIDMLRDAYKMCV